MQNYIKAGGSSDRTMGDNEMAEMVIEWLGEGNYDLLLNQGDQMEIDMTLDEASRLESMDDLQTKEYFDEAYRSIAEFNESEVPVETEATLAGEDIEYADSIDQAEFNENVAELEKFLIEQETATRAEMYDIPEGELLAQFVDQPELVDDAPPMIDHSQSLFGSFYAAFVNKFDAVEKALKLAKSRGAAVLDGANTELLISAYSGIIGNIKYTLQRNTYSMDENGNMVKSGIGLKPILEAFDAKLFGVEPSKAKRKADLAKFLIAKRIQQDLQNYTIPGVRDEAPKVEDEVEIDSGLPDAPNLNEQYDQFIADGENVYDSSEQEIAEQKEGFDYGYTAAYGEEVEVNDLLGIDDSLSNVFEMGYYYGREAGKANKCPYNRLRFHYTTLGAPLGDLALDRIQVSFAESAAPTTMPAIAPAPTTMPTPMPIVAEAPTILSETSDCDACCEAKNQTGSTARKLLFGQISDDDDGCVLCSC